MATVDNIVVKRPCEALWSEMRGDDGARHCALCRKTVYDSMALDACDLERMAAAPQKPCVRVHRDALGRVLTRDRIVAVVAAVGLAGCVPHRPVDPPMMGDIQMVDTGLFEPTLEPTADPPATPAIPPR